MKFVDMSCGRQIHKPVWLNGWFIKTMYQQCLERAVPIFNNTYYGVINCDLNIFVNIDVVKEGGFLSIKIDNARMYILHISFSSNDNI